MENSPDLLRCTMKGFTDWEIVIAGVRQVATSSAFHVIDCLRI